MTEKKEKKNILIGALLVAIIAMAIGYASLAQQLTINGTSTISSTWDVHIQSISEGVKSNSTGVTPTVTENSKAVASGNLSASFDVSFQTPGDTIEYDIVVVNDGSLDAKLDTVTTSATAAVTPGDTYEESTLLTEKGLNYEITIDGADITTAARNLVIPGRAGESASTKKVHVKVWWDAAATTIPEKTAKKLTVTMSFVQA